MSRGMRSKERASLRESYSLLAAGIVLIIAASGGVGVSEACVGRNGTVPTFKSIPTVREKPPSGPGIRARAFEPTLAILVDFTDRTGQTTQDTWNTVLLSTNWYTMRHYFRKVSYFDYNPDATSLDLVPAEETSGTGDNGIVGWYQITYVDVAQNAHSQHPYNVAGGRWEDYLLCGNAVAKAAIQAADQDVDFASYDADSDGFIKASELHIIVVVAGYEASYVTPDTPDTWRHHSAFAGVPGGPDPYDPPIVDGVSFRGRAMGGGYSIVGELDPDDTIIEYGLVAHEIGHDLGLPDLYDTDFSNGGSAGIGEWGLMGSGDWLPNPAFGAYPLADCPAHPCAWSKIELGWLNPTTVTSNVNSMEIPRLRDDRFVVKIPTANQEYFLVSHRHRIGYDQFVPGSGLAIWHIDPDVGTGPYANADETHKLVDLECADQESEEDHVTDADDLDQNENRGDKGDVYLGDYLDDTPNTAFCAFRTVPSSEGYDGNTTDVAVFDIRYASGYEPPILANIWIEPERISCSTAGGDYMLPSDDCGGGLAGDCTGLFVSDECGGKMGIGYVSCYRLEIASMGVDLQTPSGLALAEPGMVWYSDCGKDSIGLVETNSGHVIRAFEAPGPNPKDLAWDGENLWCVDADDATIYSLDPLTGEVVHSIPAPGYSPYGLTWKTGSLWCSDTFGGRIYVIRPVDGAILHMINSPVPGPKGLAFIENYLWVVDSVDSLLYGMILSPCAVELSSFAAKGYDRHVEVKWTTDNELDNAGFNVYRSLDKDGDRSLLTEELIPAMGNSSDGASYSFIDEDVACGLTYHYWLQDVDLRGKAAMHGPVSATACTGTGPTPNAFRLAQNYPNPFSPTTEITYDLLVDSHVRLDVYDARGQKVASLVDEHQEGGAKVVSWGGRDEKGLKVPAGVYFYRLSVGNSVEAKKMLLLR